MYRNKLLIRNEIRGTNMEKTKKNPAYVGFKPSPQDLERIKQIKASLPAAEHVSTAQVLRMALDICAQYVNKKPGD